MGRQQIVEIAKALSQDVRILIMDEPTSALTGTETEALFRIIRELTAQGVAIIYISHKLEELLRIGDYVTVLRDGKLAAHARAQDVNITWIIEKMVGRTVRAPSRHNRFHESATSAPILKVESLSLPRVGSGFTLENVNFTLNKGEILAKAEIFQIINRLAEQGLAILFVSSELPEVLAVPDRILVLSKGKVTGEFTHDDVTEEKLVRAASALQQTDHPTDREQSTLLQTT
jgi:erythritol transport system ATP-binding protein